MGIIRGFDQGKSRYKVSFGKKSILSLKPTNLTQKCIVCLRGIESQPALNGQEGMILGYDGARRRYRVQLKKQMANGKDILGLEPRKLLLRKGTRVTLQNLSNDALNGLMAQIIDIDAAALRYTALCENGKAIKITLDKVLC